MGKNTIKLEIPSVKSYSRVLRLTAAGAADAAGFNIDIIEDVKVIVAEVFGSIIEAGCKGAKINFTPDDGKLEVHFATCSGEPVLKGANEMTVPILEALSGNVVIEEDGGLTLIIE
ncbi:MAG: hypothetical protein J7L77_06065 [Clostridiales bacterium]|nr:hypothetical protein [Clostridiales bacterium]